MSYNPEMIDDLQALTPQPTYSDWLTKAEAGQALGGLSVRQVERLIAGGKIQTASRPVPHRTAACVCNPGDVARMALERRASQLFVAPEGIQSPTGAESAAIVARNSPLDVSSIVRMAIDLVRSHDTAMEDAPAVPITQKAYLTLDEAVEYSGLPKAEIKRMLKAGLCLDGRKCGRWYVRRQSIEKL